MNIQSSVEFYQSHGFRPVPVHGIQDGCCCKIEKYKLACNNQCLGKVPLVEHWADIQKYTLDQFPDGCNLALQMGRQLDDRWFIGLDVDGELDIELMLELPQTLECITGRGRHLIFEIQQNYPLGHWIDVLSTRSKITGYKEGYKGSLDLRYCRGALVSPPSIHKSGYIYEWKEWMQPTMINYQALLDLRRAVKRRYPNIKRYPLWTMDPNNKGKKP